jgi:hypothetical protein
MNKITTRKTSIFKKLFRFIFLKPFTVFYIMQNFNCTYKQAQSIYKIQKHFNNIK